MRSVRADVAFYGQFDLAEGLAQARRLDDLGLVLVDPGLPGCSELEALIRFRAAFPGTRVAVISANEDEARVRAALEAGAAGYLPRTLLPKAMASAIRSLLDGGVYSPMR